MYTGIVEVLSDWPDLVHRFVGFLGPDEGLAAGAVRNKCENRLSQQNRETWLSFQIHWTLLKHSISFESWKLVSYFQYHNSALGIYEINAKLFYV